MRLHPFRAKFPNYDYITSPESFFSKVKEEYANYDENGFFKRSPQIGFYVHEIQNAKRSFLGMVACVDIRDYDDGRIKQHENTLPDKEQLQMQLLLQRKAMVKPVLLFHQHVPELYELLDKVRQSKDTFFETQFESAGVTHRFWELSDPDEITLIQKIYKSEIPECYIADGHHRSSTVALLHQRLQGKEDAARFQNLQCAFFSSDQLEVHDYNRILGPVNDFTPSRFMARISQLFDIEVLTKAARPRQKHIITMNINREWYRLRWKKEVLENWNKKVILDASLLDKHVFEGILSIEDVRTDSRFSYVEGPKGMAPFRKRRPADEMYIGFCLYPVALDDLKDVADMNMIMPPKSTWFEPRMKNGLLVYEV